MCRPARALVYYVAEPFSKDWNLSDLDLHPAPVRVRAFISLAQDVAHFQESVR
jgi:hypothetical protein